MDLFGQNGLKLQAWGTALALAVASLIISAPASAAPKAKPVAAEISDIAFDPAAIRGELPNGMKYIFLPNAKPEKALAVRLYIASGSYDETDAERGAAQALAQLALDETQNFTGGTLKKAFEAEGIDFGSLRNANANLNGTTYGVDLKDYSPAKLELSLKWLRDVASGLVMQAASLDKARSSLVEQYTLSLGGPKEVSDALNAYITPNLRTSRRDPIATPQEIKALNIKRIQEYYGKWYRPQNAYLIIVGDVSKDEIVSAVQGQFSTWSAPALQKREKAVNQIDKRGLDVVTKTIADIRPILSVCRTLPAATVTLDTIKQRIATASQFGWISVLNHRLGRIAASANSPFSSVGVQANRGRDSTTICLQTIPVGDQWHLALDSLATELRRLELYGVSSHEIDVIKADHVSKYDKLIANETDRTTADKADELARAIATQAVFTSSEEAKRVAEAVWGTITPEEIMKGYRSSWAGTGPLISLLSPNSLDKAELRKQWMDALASSAPNKPSSSNQIVWPYGDFGPKGEIASREMVNPPGFTRVKFKNGVILNFKHLTYEKDYAWIRVRFGSGHRQIDPKQSPALNLASSVIVSGGLGQLNLDEIRQVNQGKQWGLLLSVDRDAFLIRADTKIADLDRELETIAAFLIDPGFRSEANVRIPGIVDNFFKSSDSPTGKAILALSRAYGGDTLLGSPSREELLNTKMNDIAAALKTPMQTEGLEITLVADISEDKAVDLVARTFGALPKRHQDLTIRQDFKPLVYGPAQSIKVDLDGSSKTAAILAVWPTFVLDNSRRMETRSVVLATELLKTRLNARLKDAKQESFSLNATPQFPNRFDQGSINITLQVPSSEAENAQRILKEAVASLVDLKVTGPELKALKRPIFDSSKTRRDHSGWWSNLMDGSARDPSLVEVDQTVESDIRSLKPKDIAEAAAKWLKAENMIEVIAAPKLEPKPAESAATPPTSPTP